MKKLGIILGGIIVVLGIAVLCMGIQTRKAIGKQVNAEIDMNQVKDGTYTADSNGGLVYAKVMVKVKDHKIDSIDLIKHRNGKGKAAEANIDKMVAENTDNVDVVSGATVSSKTIRNAVNKALQQGLQ